MTLKTRKMSDGKDVRSPLEILASIIETQFVHEATGREEDGDRVVLEGNGATVVERGG